jgi:hypothetical protein
MLRTVARSVHREPETDALMNNRMGQLMQTPDPKEANPVRLLNGRAKVAHRDRADALGPRVATRLLDLGSSEFAEPLRIEL